MDNKGQDVGYIMGKLESMEKRIEKQERTLDEIEDKLDEISKQLSGYRHAITFVRSLLWIGVAVITLKLGDIPAIWSGK